MIRTFIAAEIPPEVRKNLAPVIARLRSAAPRVRWTQPDNLHLTFRFLGDVKETELSEIFAGLEPVARAAQPFALEVRGIGAFPNWRYPRVVWAGCGEGTEDATALAARIEDACAELGYDRERRPFRPHLTLGRVKLPADAEGLEEQPAAATYGYIDVDAVTVFMSSLRRTGPVYAPMARFSLGG